MRRLATTFGACALGACVLTTTRPERAGAQSTPPAPGATVRMSVEGVEHSYTGRLVSLGTDSVIVRVGRSRMVRVSRGQVTRLDVARRRPATTSTLEGFALGAAAGATVGILIGPSMVHSNGAQRGLEFTAHDGRVIGGVLLGVIGGAIGGVAGHSRATHWEQVPLSVATRPHGIGVALTF